MELLTTLGAAAAGLLGGALWFDALAPDAARPGGARSGPPPRLWRRPGPS